MGVETDPVIIVEEDLNLANKTARGDQQAEPYYFILPENPVINDGCSSGPSLVEAVIKQNCNGVLVENNFSSRSADYDGYENGFDPSKKHLIKM